MYPFAAEPQKPDVETTHLGHNRAEGMRQSPTPIVQMRNITKRFPGVVANRRVSLDVMQSEVLGLAGENGAGKTTLMNILYGLYQPDEGSILIDGHEIQIASPADAISTGIGMVHQHFMLVRTFTVLENLALGYAGSSSFLLRLETVEQKARGLIETYSINIDLGSLIWQLSVGEQQRVEILKALMTQARIIILDEPTAVLTPQEVEELYRIISLLRGQGKSVVFITHKLDEIMHISDRVAVLRNGSLVDTVSTSDTSAKELARMMVGRDITFVYDRPPAANEELLLRASDLVIIGDRGEPAVRGLDLSLYHGEVLGIAGVDGNGQRELCEGLAGTRPISTGSLEVRGHKVEKWGSRRAIEEGIAHVPEDRQRTGLILDFPLWKNAILKEYGNSPFCRFLFLRYSVIFEFTERLLAQYSIQARSIRTFARTLSGGNQQRLVLARELSGDPDILIANQPTRGLDIAAMEFVHKRLLQHRERGKGVILVSRELSEIFSLSDRIAVMYGGRIMDTLGVQEATKERVGALMAGLAA